VNPDKQAIILGAGEIHLAKQYYKKPSVLTNLTRTIAETFYILDSGKSIKEEPIPAAKNDTYYGKAKAIVDFEALLAGKLPEPELQNDVKYYYKPKTVGEVDKLVPNISLLKFLQTKVPPGFNLSQSTTVIYGDSHYFGNLTDVITNTPRKTIHDYFQWRIAATWIDRLFKDYNTPIRTLKNQLAGKESEARQDRYRTCITDADHFLGHLMGSVFIQRKFTPKDKAVGDRVIMDIKKVFHDNMKTLDWMSDETKKIAAQKGMKY
jgi:endothelin-converting enzyme